MAGRIVYLKVSRCSHAKGAVRRQLFHRFPGHELLVWDIYEIMRVRKGDMLRSLASLPAEYGRHLLAGRIHHEWARWITASMFRSVRRVLRRRLAEVEDLAFTFQTQSLFDCGLPGVPHFIYTDHTLRVHEEYPHRRPLDLYSAAWQALEPEIYDHATRIFTMSDHVTRSLLRHYGCNPHRIRRVGVGCNAYMDGDTPDVEHRLTADYTPGRILFVGNDWELKGGPQLLAAFRRVRRRHPRTKLVIVGCTPEVSERGVEVVGPIPLPDVVRHYERATIFCMPSRGDAFGIVYLEAFLNALPVVAPNIGAPPDFVRDGVNGFLVEPDDIEALADRLEHLVARPKLCLEFGLDGRRVVLDYYTWDLVGERLHEEIEASLAGIAAPSDPGRDRA